ncbi:DUF2924 domain-containing protein [Limibaculum sp. FT325]|uniref:DUF2924 domain-containing protein n=1 Tax=Thermohalobaculum sediminis TaxID=2939436 RepID=UPI0020BFD0AE|nr:DUF2924 domain-containing protein [Limibaculum sediminis]MCL5778861.1 DUF2924 domain-containing protein [Limibaculum sediminis]
MTGPVEAIAAMGRDDLLGLWARVMEDPPPERLSTALMRRILAFEVQAGRYGGLPDTARRRLATIARDKARKVASRLAPGGRLIREWNGVSHVVEVAGDGYHWRGRRYRSLSAIAREITGAHWSGPRFFGLDRQRARR